MSETKKHKFSFLPDAFIEKFEALKKEFNIVAQPNPTPQPTATPAPNFMEAVLEDGTKVKVMGELVAGTPIVVVTDMGETPAPDGEHKLQDGTVIVVKDGLIESVTAPAAAAPAAPVMPDMAAQLASFESALNDLKIKFAAIETEKAEMAAKFNAQSEATKKQVSQIFELVGTLMELPSAAPIEDQPVKASTFSKKEKLLTKFK